MSLEKDLLSVLACTNAANVLEKSLKGGVLEVKDPSALQVVELTISVLKYYEEMVDMLVNKSPYEDILAKRDQCKSVVAEFDEVYYARLAKEAELVKKHMNIPNCPSDNNKN